MAESTINICLCDSFFVGVSYNLSLVNLLKSYPYHLAVLSRSISDNVNGNSCKYLLHVNNREIDQENHNKTIAR